MGLGLGFAPPIFPGLWDSARAVPPRKVTLPAAGLNWKAPGPVCFEQLALAPWVATMLSAVSTEAQIPSSRLLVREEISYSKNRR